MSRTCLIAFTHHVAQVTVLLVSENVLERLQEFFLELEVGKFILIKELHSQLTQRIHRKASDQKVIVAANLSEHTQHD